MHNLWAPNSNARELNFTIRYDGSLDIVIIPVVLDFPKFILICMQQPSSEDGRVWIFAPKKDVSGPRNFFGGGRGAEKQNRMATKI